MFMADALHYPYIIIIYTIADISVLSVVLPLDLNWISAKDKEYLKF